MCDHESFSEIQIVFPARVGMGMIYECLQWNISFVMKAETEAMERSFEVFYEKFQAVKFSYDSDHCSNKHAWLACVSSSNMCHCFVLRLDLFCLMCRLQRTETI
jgi:hypothetical protein